MRVLRDEHNPLRTYAPRVMLLRPDGFFIRSVPAALAREMVAAGEAAISEGNGRIKAIRLIRTAETTTQRLGPPSPPSIGGVSFIRRLKLDTGHVVWEHHPRALWD